MDYSFINIHTKSKVALETDKYLIRRRIKSKLSYSDNYLDIKILPTDETELNYFISACRSYFRNNDINFIHLGLPENKDLPKNLEKYLIKENFNKMNFKLYHLNTSNFKSFESNNYQICELEKQDYDKYMNFIYKLDLEIADENWAEHNQKSIYEDIRSDNIIQLIAKDNNKIVGIVNVILNDDFLEIDSLYVLENYRRKKIAKNLIKYAVENYQKQNIILVADNFDTPKFMYENMGFKEITSKIYYLKSNIK